jgi:hypothetical protein
MYVVLKASNQRIKTSHSLDEFLAEAKQMLSDDETWMPSTSQEVRLRLLYE